MMYCIIRLKTKGAVIAGIIMCIGRITVDPLYPCDGAGVAIHTAVQREFIARDKRDGIESAPNWLRPLKQGQELSHPEPVRFSWETDSAESLLGLSENKEFRDADSPRAAKDNVYKYRVPTDTYTPCARVSELSCRGEGELVVDYADMIVKP